MKQVSEIQELQEIGCINTGDMGKITGDSHFEASAVKLQEIVGEFEKIQENFTSSKNTGGISRFIGVIGDYRRLCQVCLLVVKDRTYSNRLVHVPRHVVVYSI